MLLSSGVIVLVTFCIDLKFFFLKGSVSALFLDNLLHCKFKLLFSMQFFPSKITNKITIIFFLLSNYVGGVNSRILQIHNICNEKCGLNST